jgi:hypothetical protein
LGERSLFPPLEDLDLALFATYWLRHSLLNLFKSVGKTVLEDLMSVTKALFRTNEFLAKLNEILTAEIFEFAAFEQIPNLLLG